MLFTKKKNRAIIFSVIDYNSPKLYLDKMSYQPGEQGLANCSVERTYPAPNITWFINGQRVINYSFYFLNSNLLRNSIAKIDSRVAISISPQIQ